MYNLNGKTYSQNNIKMAISSVDQLETKATVTLQFDMSITFTRDPAACNLYQITKTTSNIVVTVDGVPEPSPFPSAITYGVARVGCDNSIVMQTNDNFFNIAQVYTYSELKLQKNCYLCGYVSVSGSINDPNSPLVSQISSLGNLKLKQN